MMFNETQKSMSPSRGGCVVMAMAFAIAASLSLFGLYVCSMTLDAFLVVKGYSCEGCVTRKRGCAGVEVESEMRDGQEVRCVGVPVGPWHCFVVERERGGYVREACPQ
jgi:hypothetical protein